MDPQTAVLNALQKLNNQTLEELFVNTGIDSRSLTAALETMIQQNKVEYEDCHYRLRLVFAPFRKGRKVGDLKYSAVLGTAEFPPAYLNKYTNHIVRRFQGNAGTCVGQSTAASRDLEYVMLTGEIPTAADKATVTRNIGKTYGQCWYDILYPTSFSAAWVYYKAREEAHQPDDDGGGAYVWAACKVLKEQGCCLESQWRTPKDGRTDWKTPVPGSDNFTNLTAGEFAPQHKIDGYSTIDTPNEMKAALYKHGYALIGIQVFDDIYDNMNAAEFTANGQSVGGHALVAVGYDEDYLYVINSWEDCPQIWKMKWAYYVANVGESYVILDDVETRIAARNYVKVPITSSYPAEITILQEKIGTTPTSALLNGGTSSCGVWHLR